MLINYFKVALRSLLKHKGHSFINIAGLSLGLTCCLLIFQYVAHEYSFDSFNVNGRNLYRVVQTESRNGSEPKPESLNGYAVGPALAESVPEVVRFARLHPDYTDPVISIPEQPSQAFEEEHVYYADPAFLQMFSYRLLSGDPARALVDPGTLLLSESSARRYFGAANPMGRVLHVTGWISGDFHVNGVFHDPPANSHLRFDFLLPMADLLQKSRYGDSQAGWNWTNFNTYCQLREGADAGEAGRKLTNVFRSNRETYLKQTNTTVDLSLQPLQDVHLNDTIFAPKSVTGSYRTVYFFTLIGMVTLLIALVNYINLATARSLDRAREVGVRKVIGAQRGQLVLQFLFESVLTVFIASALAIVLADLLMPVVNRLAGAQLTDALWASPRFLATFLATLCIATLLAGLYPAFMLSSFRPAAALKGKAGSFAARHGLRRGLVVLQFAASIVLLAGTAIVYSQLDYMRHLDLGIDLQQILTVPGPRVFSESVEEPRAIQRLTRELRQIPAIRQIATSSALPGLGFNWYSSEFRRENADPSTGVRGALAWIDTSFASLYGLRLEAGDGFKGISAPVPQGQPLPVIANETAIKAAGFITPAEAVNQLVSMGGTTCRIVGVFKDFSWSSAHAPREAALFALTEAGGQLSLKVSTANLPQTIVAVERIYSGLFPGNPFRYAFADEEFDEQYQNDRRFATLFSLFAVLAILIACLGLFGLASFSARQRTKEIGIRKVLGASVAAMVSLLSKELIKLVLLANVAAWPLAYFAMNKWLQSFAYRINVSWWVFALAGGLALVIALLTVSSQAIKAALANPVDSLRYE